MRPYASHRTQTSETGEGNAPTAKALTFEDACATLGLDAAALSPDVRGAITAMASEISELRVDVATLSLALDQAQSLADHDALVPVFNRRAFFRELARAVSFCARYDAEACLIFIDLDGFKAINDRLGHAFGDEALQKLGAALISRTRQSDIVGRLGGDEFALLLINADESDARAKADELLAAISAIQVSSGEATMKLAASCGISSWRKGEAAKTFLARADEAMYRDKIRKREASRPALYAIDTPESADKA